MVSAWSSKNKLVLGQVKVDDKSNEITAIPCLLKKLKLKGCIVTIDAMGCQKKIVKEIIEKEADYLITLKDNQPNLYQRTEKLFAQVLKSDSLDFDLGFHLIHNETYGQEEIKIIYVLNQTENNIKEVIDPEDKWKNMQSIIKVESFYSGFKNKKKNQTRYFISSLLTDAKSLAEVIQTHWTIENQLNWVLDVQFSEDDSRIRMENSPENMAIIRQLALSLLNQDTTSKKSIKSKQNQAGWNNEYLFQLLTV